MYLKVSWIGFTDPYTGETYEGGEATYREIANLSFAPQTDLTGNSLPVSEYTCDIITAEAIPFESAAYALYDDRDLLWCAWPVRKVIRISEQCVRIKASSWLKLLEYRQLEARMFTGETAAEAIEECFGSAYTNYYTISPTIQFKTVSGYAPAQSARERLTWLLFVLGAYAVDIFRDDVYIRTVDNSATLIPLESTYLRPSMNTSDVVTRIRITTYLFRRAASEEEWKSDDSSYIFPLPWIATEQTFELINPDTLGPDSLPLPGIYENAVEIDGLYLVNPDNVSDIAARLSQYWFDPTEVTLDCINNRAYMPGDLVTAYAARDSMVTGYIQQATFAFGKQAKSTLKLVGVERLPTGALTINYMYGSRRIGRAVYHFPVGYAYSIENLYLDKTENNRRRVYRPTTERVEGTIPEGGAVANVEYEIALELYKGVLHVISVDGVTEQAEGDIQVAVIS